MSRHLPSLRARWAAGTLFAVVLAALFAGFAPHGETETRAAAGAALEILRAPSHAHWLGTDDVGRDVLARLLYGARTSLAVATLTVLLALLAGTLAGAVAATRRGALDALVVGACDLLSAVPSLLLVVAAQGLLGRASFFAMVALIALPRAADVARLARSEIHRALAAPFAEAARASGASPARVALRHALPHAAPQLAVAAAATVSHAVLAEAALTFLGFGVAAPRASWGELLLEAHANGLHWWLAAPAGAAVLLVTLAANALADELTRPRARVAP